jgi:hypothetical protein
LILLAWPLLFTKGKKHYLTIQGAGEEFAIFRLHKGNVRNVLAVAESRPH